MDEQKKTDEPPEESLASVPPNPYDTPVTPLTPLVKRAGIEVALFTAAGAGALLLLAGTMTPCVGSTRSAKLKWEERCQQIEQSEREALSNNPDPS
jgi:hypothetical protein